MRGFELSIVILFVFFSVSSQAQHIVQLGQGKPTSVRGLSVVDDSVAWVSGSRGYVGITRNGGKDWTWQQVKGFEKADFRDIEAFSDKNAIIMSSGTPALVLKTTDGGATWREKYQNSDTTYFLDAMDFDSPQHGLILGDPIKGKFLLLETKDGGETWGPFANMPNALPGEASFAASGTCLRVASNYIGIASGGTDARFVSFNLTHYTWKYDSLPIVHHKSSQGAFSFALGKNRLLFVGGDYADDKKADSVAAYAKSGSDETLIYTPIKTGPTGFQSSVEFLNNDTFLATGTVGSNITTDGGKTWILIDGNSFNVCRKAKHGKLVLLAGNGGKIGMLKM